MKIINFLELNQYSSKILELERIFYEKESQEQLLAFLINHNMISSNDYLRLWEEYINIVKLWKKTINTFEKEVVNSYVSINKKLRNWEYNFEEQELRIYEL